MDISVIEEVYITQNLSRFDAARKLGISKAQLTYYLEKFGIRKNSTVNPRLGEDRLCPNCEVFRLKEEFYAKNRGGKLSPGSWCKYCMNAQVVERQRRYKQQALDYKGGCCQYCGFKEYQGALEFHHIDPTQKDFDMVRFSKNPLNDLGKAELDKCVLLCANHHRMIHVGLITLE